MAIGEEKKNFANPAELTTKRELMREKEHYSRRNSEEETYARRNLEGKTQSPFMDTGNEQEH